MKDFYSSCSSVWQVIVLHLLLDFMFFDFGYFYLPNLIRFSSMCTVIL